MRGGYYTSSQVADWLCAWAIRSLKDSVLEPSCGDGAFLVAAAARLKDLGAKSPTVANHLTGIEIIAKESAKARARLEKVIGVRASETVKTKLEEQKKTIRRRYNDAVVALSRSYALASASDYAKEVRDDVGFFQAVKAALNFWLHSWGVKTSF